MHKNSDNVVTVCLIGAMSISYQGQTLDVQQLKSNKLALLLAYLFYYHDHDIEMTKLMDIIWAVEDIKNPRGALKNLMYRVRQALHTYWPDTRFWQIYGDSYRWNPELILKLDVARIHELMNRIMNESVPTETQLKEWMSLYRGNFLEFCHDNDWAAYTRHFYQSQYFTVMQHFCDTFSDHGQYMQIEQLAKHGMDIDAGDERPHLWYIQSFLCRQKYHVAKMAYDTAINVLYEGDENEASDQMQTLRRDIEERHNTQIYSLNALMSGLLQSDSTHAIFCNGPIFRKFCQRQLQYMKRTGSTAHLLLLSWSSPQEPDKCDIISINHELKKILRTNLRASDLITCLDDFQFLILLYDTDDTGAQIVADRIQQHIYEHDKLSSLIAVKYEATPLGK